MKKILLILMCTFALQLQAQEGVAINNDGSAPDGSAILDLKSTTKGILIPRMTESQRTLISNVATGLLVYQTDGTSGFYFYNGSAWVSLSEDGSGWSLSGNAISSNPNSFIGTTDQTYLNFRTNDLLRWRISPVNGAFAPLNNGGSVFIGDGAGDMDNLNNGRNVYIGQGSGNNNQLGSSNVGIGYLAINNNYNSFANTAIGFESQALINDGFHNTTLGYHTLSDNTYSVEKSTAIGSMALASGSNNVAVGFASLQQNLTGEYNTAIGNETLNQNWSGWENTALGYHALRANENESGNTAIGYNSMSNPISGNFNTSVGHSSMSYWLGYGNVSIGANALRHGSGNDNIAIGRDAMYWVDNLNEHDISQNIAIGKNAQSEITNYLNNVVAIGSDALAHNGSSYTVGIGDSSLLWNHGDYNTAIGSRASAGATVGHSNTSIGYKALYSNDDFCGNVAIGDFALSSLIQLNVGSTFDLIGNNVAVGSRSMSSTIDGVQNVAIGYGAMQESISASRNIAIGEWASKNTSGEGNISIGHGAGDVPVFSGNRNILIGYQAQMSDLTLSGQLNIGNLIYGNGLDGSGTIISTGNIGIGVDEPTAKLDVNGSIRMRANAINGYIIQGDANGNMNWVNPNTIFNTNNQWHTSGNFGTTNGTDFIGTTDAQDLDIRTNNVVRARITQKGQIETLNTGGSVFIGEGAGANDDLSDNRNVFIGRYAGESNTTGNQNTAIGASALDANTTGNLNTALGFAADATSSNLNNATAIGYNAKVDASNKIQLGNTSVTSVATSGALTTGAVTYPNTDGTVGQVLTTDGAGVVSFQTPSDAQDLSLTGNTLSLTNDATTVDLSGYLDNTDSQDLSLTGNTLSLTNDATTVDLSAYQSNTLDGSYDEGGAGAGREIDAVDGTVAINGEDGLVVTGTFGSGLAIGDAGGIPQGPGTRMFFNPNKAAFRAGFVDGTQWDNANIGNYSTAMGSYTTASGNYSTSMGYHSTASGNFSTAIGYNNTASGGVSTAMGFVNIASGEASTAMGYNADASGDYSTAMGSHTTASGALSTAMGFGADASGDYSTAMGFRTDAWSYSETVIGSWNTAYTPASTTEWNSADRLFVVGNGTGWGAESDALVILKNGTMLYWQVLPGHSQNWFVYEGSLPHLPI